MGRLVIMLVVLAATGALAAPAATAQVPFGANLNRPANAQYGCETLPTTDAFGNRFFLFTGATTCTYLATGSLSNTSETTAPGAGIVTRVRVKVGPVTGQMQITVLRATRSGIGFACCFHVTETPPFTPTPNAVTTLNVRLPLRTDLNPAFGETVDRLGITVLAPGVPIPAHEIGNPGDITNPGALAFFPHVRPGDERADGAGIGGVQPLIGGDFVPLCGAGIARAAQAGGCAPLLGFDSTRARVAAGRAALQLLCNLGIPCTGRLRLQARRNGGRTFGSARVSLAAGAAAPLQLRLTRAGRALLVGRRSARVWANTTLTGATGSTTVSRRLTLVR